MSKRTISTITDKVMDGMAERQNRPIDRVCPVLFVDAVDVEIRSGAGSRQRAAAAACVNMTVPTGDGKERRRRRHPVPGCRTQGGVSPCRVVPVFHHAAGGLPHPHSRSEPIGSRVPAGATGHMASSGQLGPSGRREKAVLPAVATIASLTSSTRGG
ncbi:hypothetical protein Shyhy01_18230 [Streptomyces hygroscopicus subsp. hygroscopicus]|nr:hypothetical protein Shyhy01_18230 [Streptomyces hygroscopicus subsp. hygroscopicus]